MRTEIYALCDPRTGEVRYIGKTSVGVRARLRRHLRQAKTRKTYNHRWIMSLRDVGTEPHALFVCTAHGDGASEERRVIALCRVAGFRLTNATDGGEGLFNPSVETRQRMRDAHLGHRASASTRAKMRVAQMVRRETEPVSEKLIQRMVGPNNPGRHPSAETRARMSRAARARWADAKK